VKWKCASYPNARLLLQRVMSDRGRQATASNSGLFQLNFSKAAASGGWVITKQLPALVSCSRQGDLTLGLGLPRLWAYIRSPAGCRTGESSFDGHFVTDRPTRFQGSDAVLVGAETAVSVGRVSLRVCVLVRPVGHDSAWVVGDRCKTTGACQQSGQGINGSGRAHGKPREMGKN